MKRRIERAPLPDGLTIRQLVGERASELCDGAIVVDADARGSTGVDLLMVDERGRPIFVDVVTENADGVLSRVFEHLAWIEENKRLFFLAYAEEGVSDEGIPEIVFVAGRYPRGVLRGLPLLSGVTVRLVKAEFFIIDGKGELFLEEVASTVPGREQATPVVPPDSGPRGIENAEGPAVAPPPEVTIMAADEDPAVTASTDEDPVTAPDADPVIGPDLPETAPTSSTLEDQIESESVLGLLKLFRSGVDGLDPRIVETESNGGAAFELQGTKLAGVSVSPGSFTVTPGDRAGNPIVVSDRVSLERALNAIVSLFVREGQPDSGESRSSTDDALDTAERSELVGIWGSGLGGSEN